MSLPLFTLFLPRTSMAKREQWECLSVSETLGKSLALALTFLIYRLCA